ncbi:RNA 2',3'-cyclic phosphodiesterase [Paenisporosarcina sp. TG20]|uniref:RNA 2',3'-cyclic phosphodiesterase n=1 Tax=Paenisporosarcina sp. TG20 TaxID=1211706 RepID=UPI000380C22F|nr:RNA 2',3'-cyclic phosphodiesterase [Paenisporosarcina sp. TG20]
MQHYFIGFKLPEEIAYQLDELRKEWHLDQSHKIVPAAVDLHLTLLYLGAVEERLLTQLLYKLNELSGVSAGLNIKLNGISTFGNPSTPRVVYASIEEELNLAILQSSIREKCQSLFSKIDKKPFVPHVTLAKKWKGQSFSKEMYIEKLLFSVNEFSVYSINPGQVPSYQVVHSIPLKEITS